jgi:hypothetical protein
MNLSKLFSKYWYAILIILGFLFVFNAQATEESFKTARERCRAMKRRPRVKSASYQPVKKRCRLKMKNGKVRFIPMK